MQDETQNEAHSLDHLINFLRREVREMEEDLKNIKHESTKRIIESGIKSHKNRIEFYLNG